MGVMGSRILNTGVNTLTILLLSLHVLCCLGVLGLLNGGFVVGVFFLLAFGGSFGGGLIVIGSLLSSRRLLRSLGGLLGGDGSVGGSIGGISLCCWSHGRICSIGGAGPVWTFDGNAETGVTHTCGVGLEVVGCTDGVPVDLVSGISLVAVD